MGSIGKLAVLGAGAMGSAFAAGLVNSGAAAPGDITLADVDGQKLAALADQLGVRTSQDNREAVRGADVVMAAVKPNLVVPVLAEIADEFSPRQLVVSIAAGVRTESVEFVLPDGVPVIRAMPNTPCRIREGAVGFCRGRHACDDHAAIASAIFDAVGISVEVPEDLMNAVTAVSGSGPAYVFLLMEALQDAGAAVGLPPDTALKLAEQTVLGAARMAGEASEHPARLREQVTSPGGTTMAALEVFLRSGFPSIVTDAVRAAVRRAEELA